MLNIYKYSETKFEIDANGAKEAFMTKTAIGWLIEVTANEDWNNPIVFYWVEETAKAAFKECSKYVRNKRH